MSYHQGGFLDISNTLGAAHPAYIAPVEDNAAGKRGARTSNKQTFIDVVEEAGCTGLAGPQAGSRQVEVEDTRHLRRHLEGKLARDRAMRERWLAGLLECLDDEALLHAALLPMAPASQAAYVSGDSFLRLAMSLAPIQQPLLMELMARLPALAGVNVEGMGPLARGCVYGMGAGGGAGADQGPCDLAGMLLGQMRWLEVMGATDSSGLVERVREVLPVCPPPLQRGLVAFLPEVAGPGDHEGVVHDLCGLIENDPDPRESGLLAPVCEALSALALDDALQDHAVVFMTGRLAAVEVPELPGLVRFLVSHAGPLTAHDVVRELRTSLPLGCPCDPRLASPSPAATKGKGRVGPGERELPEVLLMRELLLALPANEHMAAAVLKAVTCASAPGVLSGGGGGRGQGQGLLPLDLWLLLVLSGEGRSKGVEGLLRRKAAEGVASRAWLARAIAGGPGHPCGHAPALALTWRPLLALAASLATAPGAAAAASLPSGQQQQQQQQQYRPSPSGLAAHLYATAFATFSDGLARQELLHAIHGHLGSGVAGEVATALTALETLARNGCTAAVLAQYGSYLANVLDHLELFDCAQLLKLFGVFALITCPLHTAQPGQALPQVPAAAAGGGGAAGGGAGTSGSGSGLGSGGGGGGGGSRLEDQLKILVNKALAQPKMSYKRIGVCGAVAMLRRDAVRLGAMGQASSEEEPGVQAWQGRLEQLLSSCKTLPPAMALLLDLLAHAFGTPLPTPGELLPAPLGSGAGQAHGLGLATQGPGVEEGRGSVTALADHVPPACAAAVDSLATGLFECTFVADMDPSRLPSLTLPGAPYPIKERPWLVLDASADFYLPLWQLAASSEPGRRGALVWLAPLFRLMVSLKASSCEALAESLTSLGAVFSAGLGLPPLDLLQGSEGVNSLHELPPCVSAAVLSALHAAAAWLRESLGFFALAAAAAGGGAGPGGLGTMSSGLLGSATVPFSASSEEVRQSILAKLPLRAYHSALIESLLAHLLTLPHPIGGAAALAALPLDTPLTAPTPSPSAAAGGGLGDLAGSGAGSGAGSFTAAMVRFGAPAAAKPTAGRGAAGAAAKAGTAATSSSSACLTLAQALTGLRARLRALPLAALCVVGQDACASGEAPQEPGPMGQWQWQAWGVRPHRLAGAQHLLTDLRAKLAVLVRRAGSSGGGAGGFIPPWARAAAAAAPHDPSLDTLTLQAFLSHTLQPLLPALRAHLDAATALLNGGQDVEEVEGDVCYKDVCVSGDGAGPLVLGQLSAVAPALSPEELGASFTRSVVELIAALAAAQPHHPPGFTAALLEAMAPCNSSSNNSNKGQQHMAPPPPHLPVSGTAPPAPAPAPLSEAEVSALIASVRSAGQFLDGLRTCGSDSGRYNFGQDMCVLRALKALWLMARALAAQQAAAQGKRLCLLPTSSSSSRQRMGRMQQGQGQGQVGQDGGLVLRPLAALASDMSMAACAMLQASWSGARVDVGGQEVGGAAAGGSGVSVPFSWRGQGAAIVELVGLHVAAAPDPLDTLAGLCRKDSGKGGRRAGGGAGSHDAIGLLARVPPRCGPKQGMEPMEGYASLCDVTFAAWYKAAGEALLTQWGAVAGAMAGAAAAAAAAAGGSGGGKGRGVRGRGASAGGRHEAWEADASGMRVSGHDQDMEEQEEGSVEGGGVHAAGGSGDLDREQASAMVAACAACADSFAGLMLIVQEHSHRANVLACALGVAGKYIELLLKALPWWRLVWSRHAAPLLATVRELQRGTRAVNSFCAEGKARRAAGVAAKVPGVKRGLEALVIAIRTFLASVGQGDCFETGTLKHRDASGAVVASQYAPTGDSDDDEEEEAGQGGGDDDDHEHEEEEAGAGRGGSLPPHAPPPAKKRRQQQPGGGGGRKRGAAAAAATDAGGGAGGEAAVVKRGGRGRPPKAPAPHGRGKAKASAAAGLTYIKQEEPSMAAEDVNGSGDDAALHMDGPADAYAEPGGASEDVDRGDGEADDAELADY